MKKTRKDYRAEVRSGHRPDTHDLPRDLQGAFDEERCLRNRAGALSTDSLQLLRRARWPLLSFTSTLARHNLLHACDDHLSLRNGWRSVAGARGSPKAATPRHCNRFERKLDPAEMQSYFPSPSPPRARRCPTLTAHDANMGGVVFSPRWPRPLQRHHILVQLIAST